MSSNFKISQFQANEKLLRKLGPAETIYDYELTNKSHLLVSAMKFVTKFDIFFDLRLIETSINVWKCLHPFLRTKIVTQAKDGKEYFSSDHFFLLNTEKSTSLDNVGFYKTEFNNDSIEDKHLDYFSKLLYEREFNNDPIHPIEELLWRLIFVELKRDHKQKEFTYFVILNIHHGITDASCNFSILSQLLKIFEDILYERTALNSISQINHIPLSVEALLLKEDLNILNKISQLPTEIALEQKIPASFIAPSLSENETLEIDTDFLKMNIKFICVKPIIGKAGNWCNEINGSDLVLQNKFINVTKFKEILIDKTTFNKICLNSKSKEIKLTGCLNLIYLLATHKTYMTFSDDKKNEINFHIYYHLMVNLRSYLNLDSHQMGFFASVLTGEFKFESEMHENQKYQAFLAKFWEYAKKESEIIHSRLKQNEHVEAAKIDSYLLVKQLSETNGKISFPNGGVHYAFSNIGILNPPKLELFYISKYYYQVSQEAQRWSSIIFNGVSTLDNNLIWGITYNSNYIRDTIVDNVIKNVLDICNKIAN